MCHLTRSRRDQPVRRAAHAKRHVEIGLPPHSLLPDRMWFWADPPAHCVVMGNQRDPVPQVDLPLAVAKIAEVAVLVSGADGGDRQIVRQLEGEQLARLKWLWQGNDQVRRVERVLVN